MNRASIRGHDNENGKRSAELRIKRAIDAVGSAVALLLASPLLVALAIVVFITMDRPVFYKQVRPGLKGKPFTLVKFRTMRDAVDSQESLLPDAERLTSCGKVLRSMSLDELPTLWNVFRGELSLVGPRPLLMRYLERYTPEQARRLEMKPGITGWAQVNGRNAINWERKFELDVWYVDNWSLWLDLKILALTVVKVLKRSGISGQDHATMREFTGEPESR